MCYNFGLKFAADFQLFRDIAIKKSVVSGTEIAFYIIVESRRNVVTKAFILISASYFVVSEKWTSERTLNETRVFFSNTRLFAIWMNEWLVKGYFPGPPTIYRIPDEDPPWALKFPSDVRVMDRDIRTSESVVRACLTLRIHFISRSIRCIIVAISGISDVKMCSPRGKMSFRKIRKIDEKILVIFQRWNSKLIRKSFSDTIC